MANRQDEFERIALPHTRDLLRFARRLTGNSATAEDLVQEALLLAWRSFHQFEPDTNVRAWLYRIVTNAWYGWNRKSAPLVVAEAQALGNAHTALEIREALHLLPPEQRAVIVLAIVEGFTCREIGDILGIPIGTVMSRLSRAREALRGSLAQGDVVQAAGGKL